jgi:hypothetical protein
MRVTRTRTRKEVKKTSLNELKEAIDELSEKKFFELLEWMNAQVDDEDETADPEPGQCDDEDEEDDEEEEE